MTLFGRRLAAAALACALSLAAASADAQAPRKARTPPRVIEAAIRIAVNGQELVRQPAPRLVGTHGGRLMLPVVKIYEALGISVRREGDALVATAPGKRIVIENGSTQATVDGRSVTLDEPVMVFDNTAYVPLRFVSDSLGAQVSYDTQAGRVEIASALVGHNPGLEQQGADGTQLIGSVNVVDMNSQPPTITVARGGAVRTVPIPAGTKIYLQDVIARTSIEGSLADVHVGDAMSAVVHPDGSVNYLVVRYASRSGTIAAVSPAAFVLGDGFVVTPDKDTTIELDAQPAALGDLQAGDHVVVLLNPDTDVKRAIIASRIANPATVPSPGPVAITDFSVAAKTEMRGGDTVDVTLHGTPGGHATFDIGTYLTGLAMDESAPGTYTAHFSFPLSVNIARTAVFGHLTVNGTSAPRAVSSNEIAVANSPPQIVDIAPSNNQVINNNRPSIYATFRAPTDVDVDPESVRLTINGQDVSATATRTDQFITYSPDAPLGDGPVVVVVHVADQAGNAQARSWTFTIHSH